MAEESGIQPAALQNKPTLDADWDYPLFVWQSLKGSRQSSQGVVNELPYSEFAVWALVHKLTVEQIDNLWRDVHFIDQTWVNNVRKELSEASKSATPNSANTPRRLPPSGKGQERVSVRIPMRQR